MSIEAGTTLRGRPFHGWWIVLAGFVIVAYGLGAQSYMHSLLALLVRDEFRGGSWISHFDFWFGYGCSFVSIRPSCR